MYAAELVTEDSYTVAELMAGAAALHRGPPISLGRSAGPGGSRVSCVTSSYYIMSRI